MTIAVNPAVSSREYVCNTCGGAVAGVAVFRHLIGEHQVGQIWSGHLPAPDEAPPRCGFCFANMEPRGLESGHAAICKTCQVIWLDKDALSSLTAAFPVSHLSELSVPKCSNCGAAISSPLDEKCRYCGAALELAPMVTPAPRAAGSAMPSWDVPGMSREDAGTAVIWFARALGAVLDWSSWQ
jgi:hypothetical protein